MLKGEYVLGTWWTDVRFSNRPVGVKRFQTIHHCSVDVARGCVSAWNKDPVFGVIGIQSGPRH